MILAGKSLDEVAGALGHGPSSRSTSVYVGRGQRFDGMQVMCKDDQPQIMVTTAMLRPNPGAPRRLRDDEVEEALSNDPRGK